MSEQERTEKRHPISVPGFTVDEMIRGLKVVARLAVDMDWSKLATTPEETEAPE